mgnify:CR=1 FL=1
MKTLAQILAEKKMQMAQNKILQEDRARDLAINGNQEGSTIVQSPISKLANKILHRDNTTTTTSGNNVANTASGVMDTAGNALMSTGNPIGAVAGGVLKAGSMLSGLFGKQKQLNDQALQASNQELQRAQNLAQQNNAQMLQNNNALMNNLAQESQARMQQNVANIQPTINQQAETPQITDVRLPMPTQQVQQPTQEPTILTGGITSNYVPREAIDNAINNEVKDTPEPSIIQNAIINPEASTSPITKAVDDNVNGITPTNGDDKISNLTNALMDFRKGFDENYNNSFTKGNFGSGEGGIMSRLGEGLGTVGRLAGNPLVQGLVAAGLTKATAPELGGYGALLNGYKVANDRANTMNNTQMLQGLGYNVTPSILGGVKSSDVNAIVGADYKRNMLANYYDKLMAQQQHWERQDDINEMFKKGLLKYQNGKLVIDQQKLQETQRHNKTTEGIQKEGNQIKRFNAQTGRINATETGRHNRVMETKQTNIKPQQKEGWSENLSAFSDMVLKNSPSLESARVDFIKEYGVDPLKYLKEDN